MSARLPDFLVIGAMKCGTTSLYEYLRAHPQVFMPEKKELEYFVEAKGWTRGLDWYRAQFAEAGDATAVGEASPSYANDPNHPGVPGRIAALLPHVRLVYVIRHPIERIDSHYRHRVRYDGERRSADDAVLGSPGVYLPPSRYAHQIDGYLDHFSRDRLLVVRSEALRHRRRPTLRRVYGFLGVDDGMFPDAATDEFLENPPRPRSRSWRRARGGAVSTSSVLSPAARDELTERLRPDLERLRTHLGPGFDAWGLL
jgi:hypothetical protein